MMAMAQGEKTHAKPISLSGGDIAEHSGKSRKAEYTGTEYQGKEECTERGLQMVLLKDLAE